MIYCEGKRKSSVRFAKTDPLPDLRAPNLEALNGRRRTAVLQAQGLTITIITGQILWGEEAVL